MNFLSEYTFIPVGFYIAWLMINSSRYRNTSGFLTKEFEKAKGHVDNAGHDIKNDVTGAGNHINKDWNDAGKDIKDSVKASGNGIKHLW